MEAAHTFFMANPEHMEMQQNIEDYKATARVEAPLVDREAKPHLVSTGEPCPCHVTLNHILDVPRSVSVCTNFHMNRTLR